MLLLFKTEDVLEQISQAMCHKCKAFRNDNA